jgi:putative DNA primase/helicase
MSDSQQQFVAFISGLAPEGEKVLFGIQKTLPDGSVGYVPTDTLPPKAALYVNTGSFIRSRMTEGDRAKGENIEHCLFLMLDDIGTKSKMPTIEPTWEIETSPGNFQWGYAYRPDTRPTKAEQSAAVVAIAVAGYSDPGARNAVRWSRIPGSLHKKKGFTARLKEFHPERLFSLPEILVALNVTPGAPEKEQQFAKVKDDGGDDVLAWLSEQKMVLRPHPNWNGWYEIQCPAAHEHSDGREGAGYLPTHRAFKCMHSHGDEWDSQTFLEWVADQGGPERKYGLRPELFFGKVPEQSEQSPAPAPENSYASEVFARNGLSVANYGSVVATVPGGFMLRTGENSMTEFLQDSKEPRRQGIVSPVFFGDLTENVVFVTDTWLSAAALHEATGKSVTCIEGWSFGEIQSEDGESSRALHTDLLRLIRPGRQLRLITSGTDEKWQLRMSTFRMLMMEQGVVVHAFRIPDGSEFGEAMMLKHGSREAWPDGDALIRLLFGKTGMLTRIPDEELADAAKSYTTSNADRFGKFHLDLTDRGAGTYILSRLGRGGFYFLKDRNEWVQWREGGWRSIGAAPIALINVAAHGYFKRAQALYEQAAEAQRRNAKQGEVDAIEEEAKQFYLRYKQLSSTAGRTAVLKDLQSREEVAVFSGLFDADRWLIGVKNGILDLRTGEVREARREDMMFRQCRARYVRGATHPKINRLLREITAVGYVHEAAHRGWTGADEHGFVVDAGRERWLQRRLGAALVGGNVLTSLEILYGGGSNGKSVIANMLRAVLGKAGTGAGETGYLVTVPAAAVMSSYHAKDPDAATPFLAATVGARVLMMSESRDTDKLNEQLVKNITGGDEIAYRGLYKGAAAFTPFFTPVLLTNSLPHVVEGSRALWDRLSPMEFKLRWLRSGAAARGEGGALPPEDLWFRDEAADDAAACEAFLAWLVEGCLDWQRDGTGAAPADVKASVEGYREASDTFGAWMEDAGVVIERGAFVASNMLYKSFKDWMQSNGNQAPAASVFSKRLLERYPELRSGKDNRERVIFGVRMRPHPWEKTA